MWLVGMISLNINFQTSFTYGFWQLTPFSFTSLLLQHTVLCFIAVVILLFCHSLLLETVAALCSS